MSVFTAILIGLAMGAVFGVALEKSRVFEPGIILGQMQLRNFLMLKIFLTAVVTGLVVLAVLNGLGFTKLFPKPTLYGADIIGGGLLGAGIALAGACPGTVAAQLPPASEARSTITLPGFIESTIGWVTMTGAWRPITSAVQITMSFFATVAAISSACFWRNASLMAPA